MATRPTTDIDWATDDVNDPVSGAPNKEEPNLEVKLSGLNSAEPFYRDNLNWQLNQMVVWLQYLDQRMTDNGIPQ